MDVTDEATPFTNTSTVDQFTTNGGMVELELEEGIEPDRVYRLTVAAVNEVGAADDSNEVEFSELNHNPWLAVRIHGEVADS